MRAYFILCLILLISLLLAEGEVSAPSLHNETIPNPNEEAINHANELIGKNKLDEAKKILEKFPDSSHAKFNLGIIHLKKGMNSEANQAFAEATNLDPKFDFAWENQLYLCDLLNLENKRNEVLENMRTKSPEEFERLHKKG